MTETYLPAPGDVVRVGASVGVVLDVYQGAHGMALRVLTVANVVKIQPAEIMELDRARQARLARATPGELHAELQSMQAWYASKQQAGLETLQAALGTATGTAPAGNGRGEA
jgi:hypothetical protein